MFIRFNDTLIRRSTITGVSSILYPNKGARIHVRADGAEKSMYYDIAMTVDEVERKLTLFPRLRRAFRWLNRA